MVGAIDDMMDYSYRDLKLNVKLRSHKCSAEIWATHAKHVVDTELMASFAT